MTIPPSYRLTLSPQLLSTLRRSGISFSTLLFSGYALPASSPRLGVVIAKKIAKSAVVRNTIRRRLMNTFVHNKTAFPSSDIVVYLKKDTSDLSAEVLTQEVLNLARLLTKRVAK